MIYGVGTDIVAVRRMADFWQRHGERGLTAHLSISDEQDYAVAFVILETR